MGSQVIAPKSHLMDPRGLELAKLHEVMRMAWDRVGVCGGIPGSSAKKKICIWASQAS